MPVKYRIAGIIAACTILMYGIPRLSAIKNAAAPIIGGISCPPVDAELPDTVPKSALVKTATFAGPPDAPPASALHVSIKNCPIPVFSSRVPNKINKNMNVEHAPIGVPIIPSVL